MESQEPLFYPLYICDTNYQSIFPFQMLHMAHYLFYNMDYLFHHKPVHYNHDLFLDIMEFHYSFLEFVEKLVVLGQFLSVLHCNFAVKDMMFYTFI